MLAQAEMESGDWQAADKVRWNATAVALIVRGQFRALRFVCVVFCHHAIVIPCAGVLGGWGNLPAGGIDASGFA